MQLYNCILVYLRIHLSLLLLQLLSFDLSYDVIFYLVYEN